jgi:exopolysaccharide biosynthesis protein
MPTTLLSYASKSHEMIFLICFLVLCALYYLIKPKITYEYEFLATEKHIVHIVKIKPDTYNTDIIKSLDGKKIGRETLTSIASRTKAVIAINGGFFEIGKDIDGKPSGTLVIDDKIYNIKDHTQSLLIIENGILQIQETNPKKYMINNHNISMISGIPLLLQDHKIPTTLYDKNSQFYAMPHARTAVGIRDDGVVIIVVVEHPYKKDINNLSLGEIKSILHNKKILIEQKFHKTLQDLTLDQLQNLLDEEFRIDGPVGMTIIELAEFMKKLKCASAINLDGGGSSALWIDTKLVNKQIGDTDEANGIETTRPISDAIIFK